MGSIHKLFTRFRVAVQEIWILSQRPYWSVVERCDLLYFCQHPHYGEGV